VINLLGCFIMITGCDFSSLQVSPVGVALGVAAGFLYAMVTILGKIASDNTNPFTMVFYNFLFGWITLAIFTNPLPQIIEASSPTFWQLAFGYGLIPTVGSYLFYMGGISRDLEL
jgi:drug/metabolite transporter (DMT)-like permease